MKVGWFVHGDIDGFFGLFVDNLLQLMLIAVLCVNVCGMSAVRLRHVSMDADAILGAKMKLLIFQERLEAISITPEIKSSLLS